MVLNSTLTPLWIAHIKKYNFENLVCTLILTVVKRCRRYFSIQREISVRMAGSNLKNVNEKTCFFTVYVIVYTTAYITISVAISCNQCGTWYYTWYHTLRF